MRTLYLLILSSLLWFLALDELARHPVTHTGTQPLVRVTHLPSYIPSPLPP